MRKIVVGAQVSMDGVMQAPGGPTEDPTNGFKFGGWAMPYGCPEFAEEIFTELVHALLAQDLVDAISLFMAPVVLGGGKKLFVDGSAPHAFKLARSRVAPNGLMVAHYERAGGVKIEERPDAPSERELARRERLKRESPR